MKLSELVTQIEDYIAENGDVEVWVKPEVLVGCFPPRFRITDDGFGDKIIHLFSEPIY